MLVMRSATAAARMSSDTTTGLPISSVGVVSKTTGVTGATGPRSTIARGASSCRAAKA